jgi:hypothetical protein
MFFVLSHGLWKPYLLLNPSLEPRLNRICRAHGRIRRRLYTAV